MKTLMYRSVSVAALLAWTGVAHAEAAAASSQTQVEEVVVTAQRREQSLLSVPVAVSAIGGEQLARKGVTRSSDLATVVPNLSVNSAYGNTQPNFSLRGVSVANEYNANQASPVGVYVDDSYLASRTSHGQQLYDLERVEVLRGPQGTLYGRNTTGGAINFITRKPGLDGENGDVSLGYGEYNTFTGQAAYEATLSPGVAGVRMALTYTKGDGMIRNTFPGGRDPNSTDSLGGRITLRLKPTEALDITLKAYGARDRPTQAAVHGIGVGANGTNPITGYARSGLDFYEVDQDKIGRNAVDGYGTLLRVDYHLTGALTLSSLSSYDAGKQQLGQDADGSPLQVLQIDWGSKFTQVNEELRLAYVGDRLNLQTGVYYGRDRVGTHNNFQFFFLLKGIAPFDPTLTSSGFFIGQEYQQTRTSSAAFAQGDYKLDDHWSATLGLRYTTDKAEYADGRAYIGDYNFTPIISTIPNPGPYDPTAVLPTKSNDDSAVTGRAALTYTFDNGRILYASYSRGYRAGAFNGSGYLSPAQIVYVQPETVNAYEVGAKGRFFDNTTSIAAAAFYYDYANQQVQEVVGPVAFLRNGGKSRIEGLEVEVDSRITADLRLNGALGLLDTEYKDLVLSGISLKGNELPFAPKITATLGGEWTVAHPAGGDLSLDANLAYSGRQWFSPFNDKNGNGRLQQGGFTRVNIGGTWKRDRLSLRVAATNVFNETYYVYGLDLRTSFGYDFLVPGAPRSVSATLRYEF